MSAVDYLIDDNPLSVQITHDTGYLWSKWFFSLSFSPKKLYYCKLQLKVVELHFTFITRRQLKDPDVEM